MVQLWSSFVLLMVVSLNSSCVFSSFEDSEAVKIDTSSSCEEQDVSLRPECEYRQLIHRAVVEHLQSPGSEVESDYETKVYLTLILRRDGSVQTKNVESPSTQKEFTTAVEQAVNASLPFPPIPAEVKQNSFQTKLTLVFQ